MNSNKSRKNIIIILIIIGAIPFVLGSSKLVEGLDLFQSSSELSKKEVIIPFQNTLTFYLGENDVVKFETWYSFKSFEDFGVNTQIFFEFTSTTDRENFVREVFFIPSNTEEKLGERFKDTINLLEYAQKQGRAIPLNKIDSITFSNNGDFFPAVAGELIIYQIVFTDTKLSGYEANVFRNELQPILEVIPVKEKLQADANRAILLQADETRKSNSIVIGLTLIIISLVPLGIMGQMIIRVEN